MITSEEILAACDQWDTAEPGSAAQHNISAKIVALVQSYFAQGGDTTRRDPSSTVTATTERQWSRVVTGTSSGFGFTRAERKE